MKATTQGAKKTSKGVPITLEKQELTERYAEIFSALSDGVRVGIVQALATTKGELACESLESMFPIGKSTISYHIKVLWNADLITVRKEGRYRFYRARLDEFEMFLPGLLKRMREQIN